MVTSLKRIDKIIDSKSKHGLDKKQIALTKSLTKYYDKFSKGEVTGTFDKYIINEEDTAKNCFGEFVQEQENVVENVININRNNLMNKLEKNNEDLNMDR